MARACMCDDSGTTYAGDDGVFMVDLDGMSVDGVLGQLGDLVLDPNDLDEQTKRELLLNPNFQQFTGACRGPDPKCRWCKGTGRLRMLTTETDCDCVR